MTISVDHGGHGYNLDTRVDVKSSRRSSILTSAAVVQARSGSLSVHDRAICRYRCSIHFSRGNCRCRRLIAGVRNLPCSYVERGCARGVRWPYLRLNIRDSCINILCVRGEEYGSTSIPIENGRGVILICVRSSRLVKEVVRQSLRAQYLTSMVSWTTKQQALERETLYDPGRPSLEPYDEKVPVVKGNGGLVNVLLYERPVARYCQFLKQLHGTACGWLSSWRSVPHLARHTRTFMIHTRTTNMFMSKDIDEDRTAKATKRTRLRTYT